MTTRRLPDSDQFLVAWFEDGPTTMPDRVFDVVADRIGRQRQRRPWRLPWRLPMNTPLKLTAGLAAVLVLAVAGYAVLPKSNTGPGGQPSPSPSTSPTTLPTAAPSPTAAAACDSESTGCAGRLSAGAHTSTAFQPALTFTVPDGWTNSLDIERAYTLHFDFAGSHFLQVVSQVAIPDQDATCSAIRKPGAGNTVADWVTFLTTNPGLTAGSAQAITLGGYAGQQVDVRVAEGWTATCPNSIGPAVMLITDSGATPTRTRWIDDQQTRFRIIDVAGETVIVYLEAGPEAGALEARDGELRSVIESFVLTPGT